jgi:hypothetical protein
MTRTFCARYTSRVDDVDELWVVLMSVKSSIAEREGELRSMPASDTLIFYFLRSIVG